MTKLTHSIALAAAAVLLLTACGGSPSKAGPAGPAPAGISAPADAPSIPSGSADGSGSTDGSGSSTTATTTSAADVAGVDVCALLSPADAAAVARQQGLNGAQTAKTVYKLTSTKLPTTGTDPTAGCEFSIDGQGASGTVVIQVSSAAHFEVYATDEHAVAGLGGEAYSDDDSTVVRVGGLMLSTGEDSFSNDFVVALYRTMIPHLG